ncbi:MAG: C-GCAxxG-C-C family protein [Chloroflexota bacterium]
MRTGPDGLEHVPPGIERARELFLDEARPFGCAETTFIVLKEAFGLPNAVDSAPAMALNGGLAYSGGPCGAVTGAALALGVHYGSREPDHATAKRLAREATARLMVDFEAEFGALNCRDLLGQEIRTPEAHAAFIEAGRWRTICLRQIEFSISALAPPAGGLAAPGEGSLSSPGRPRSGAGPSRPAGS